jgi:hypothetical protein
MMTFLSWFEGVSGTATAAAAMPTQGTHLSLLTFELPSGISPTMAGLTVGAVVGVLGFIAVLLLVGRPRRSRRPRIGADQVVFIPPYAPQAAQPLAPRSYAPAPAPFVPRFVPYDPSFVPSTALSARAFAKMGYGDEAEDYREHHHAAPHAPQPSVELQMLDEDDLVPSHTPGTGTPVMGMAAVTVAPVVVLSAPTPTGGVRSADKSAPHPLGIIGSNSSAMRAAPIADLSFDDGPTEIGEPYFEEPPQPRRRSDPPRIRPVVPAGPRYPEQTPS